MLSSGYMSQIIQDKLIDVKLKINEYEWITSFQISHCFPYLCNLNCFKWPRKPIKVGVLFNTQQENEHFPDKIMKLLTLICQWKFTKYNI